ncbi:mosc domain-containing protein [Diaporthe eres]|nr:mosc domain-containing protein [Diaporthe eres]
MMKITQLYVYPIKSLQGIALQSAKLNRQGVQHDRRFMLLRVHDDGHHEPVEVVRYPACALFVPEIVDGKIVVKYQIPEEKACPPTQAQKTPLEIPLEPETSGLETVEVDLYKSKTMGYRMPEAHSSWFSSCLGFETILVYVGDGKRQVLGTMSPHAQNKQNQGWLSSMKSYIGSNEDPHWLTFTCVASYLIATEASVNDVSSRLPPGEDMDIRKFRPNIVVEGEGAFDEDYWGEIEVENGVRFDLTGNCGRCVSINVDYATGRPGTGESGNVLKKLMKDRRVDKGNKYSPIFGRYGFLQRERAEIQVGQEVAITKRMEERCVWRPSHPSVLTGCAFCWNAKSIPGHLHNVPLIM